MSKFSIQIDATSLFYRFFAIPNVQDTFINSREVQTFQFAPGLYAFQTASAQFADFHFTVTPEGKVDYDANLDVINSNGFLSGRGTDKLAIRGLEVTLDASRLTSSDPAHPNETGIILASTTLTGEDWITLRRVRLVPAKKIFVQQGSAQIVTFTFDLKPDGKFAYESTLDSSQGGFLSGNGTSTLTFLGYPMTVDASAVSNLLIFRCSKQEKTAAVARIPETLDVSFGPPGTSADSSDLPFNPKSEVIAR